MERFYGGLAGTIIGFIIGAILAANVGGGLSLPPQGNDWLWIGPSTIIFMIIGVVFYKVGAWIFDLLMSITIH